MLRKVNLKLYDIDGCLFPTYISSDQEATIEDWLIRCNQALLNREVAKMNAEKYDAVILGYGTNRQDLRTDLINQHRGGTCLPVLPILQNYYAGKVACNVVLDPFLMADIYGTKAAGESYKAMLAEKYGRSKQVSHAEWVFDHSKISLIYAHAHRVALLNPDAEIVIDYFDDIDSILLGVHAFFKKNPKFLPDNLVLRLHKYADGERWNMEVIKGQGATDVNFDWSVRYMSSMTYRFVSSVKDADRDRHISSAKQLEHYHTKDHYRARGHKMQMEITSDFNTAKFLAMRELQISRLISDAKTIRTANYTTATSLHAEGLIPSRFIMQDFTISADTQQKILAEMTRYMSTRTNGNWLSRQCHNTSLTQKKMAIAAEFLEYAGNDRTNKSYKTLNAMVKDFIELNHMLEQECDKTYLGFTSSGLLRSLTNIQDILNDAGRNNYKSLHHPANSHVIPACF